MLEGNEATQERRFWCFKGASQCCGSGGPRGRHSAEEGSSVVLQELGGRASQTWLCTGAARGPIPNLPKILEWGTGVHVLAGAQDAPSTTPGQGPILEEAGCSAPRDVGLQHPDPGRLHRPLRSGSSLGGRRGWGALDGKRQQFLLDLHSTVDMPSPGSLSVNGPELGGGTRGWGGLVPTLVTALSPTSSAPSVCLEGNLPGVQAGALTRGKTHLCFFLQMGSRQYSVSPPGSMTGCWRPGQRLRCF